MWVSFGAPGSSGVGTVFSQASIYILSWGELGRGLGLTGMPAVLIMESWVEEKMRWPVSLAVVKRRDTRVERDSVRPSCIVEFGGFCGE